MTISFPKQTFEIKKKFEFLKQIEKKELSKSLYSYEFRNEMQL